MPVSTSVVILRDAMRPGSPISFGNSTPCAALDSITGPSKREKSRPEWQPSQSESVKMYLPRAIRSGVIATLMFERRRDGRLADHHVARARDADTDDAAEHQAQRSSDRFFIRFALILINASGGAGEWLTRLWDNSVK